MYIGIDTGGTYTDGVLLDPASQKVMKTGKVLTTHHDLTACIAEILERVLPDDPASISLVSLSTTLATNAIAEGKRRPVALLLLGYDPALVHQYGFEKQFGTRQYYFIQGRHSLNGVEQEPLDEAGVEKIAMEAREIVDAFSVASYAGPMNASHEERTADILSRATGLPVVQAHHLSSDLDSIRRATTATLNASLLDRLQEFLDAVEKMLAGRGVRCPVMMVRGDGSIVKSGFARSRPVEIVHSGPATSAIGGQFLAGVDTALVVDIGGTTTDIALVEKGKIQILENGATVGLHRTCVRTVKVHSFALGGDSAVGFDHYQALSIGPERLIPLSYLCSLYPEVKQDLAAWIRSRRQVRYAEELEYWLLRRKPRRSPGNERIERILSLLESGPKRLSWLKGQAGALAPVVVRELVNEEIIERAGLTPTDLLHVTGEYTPWDVEISGTITQAAAQALHEPAEAFIRRVKQMMTRKIVAEIVQFLSQQTLSEETGSLNDHRLDHFLFGESLDRKQPYLGCRIFLKVPLVGIGAPARAFLPPVAAALGTEILLPDHYEVANAVGTVVGNILVRQNAEVFPKVEGMVIRGYYMRVPDGQQCFAHYGEALAYARQALTSRVMAEAKAAGAGEVSVECEEREIWSGMARLFAWAAAKPEIGQA